MAWNFENSGMYTVKSAYRSLMTQKELRARAAGTGTGASQTDEQLCHSLWKLKIQPKIRVFWWRVIRKILPDECTLKRRHIKESNRCNVCLAMEEDLMHALFIARMHVVFGKKHNVYLTSDCLGYIRRRGLGIFYVMAVH